MRRVLLLGMILALPGPLSAQAAQAGSPPDRVEAAVAILLKGGSVADADGLFLGGWGGLAFGEHFMLGGGGIGLLQDVALPGSDSGTGSDLGMGYGGVFFKYWWDLSDRLTGEGGLILGAGHAEVHDRLIGAELGSDNFPVVEPEAAVFVRLFRRLYVGASVGYRMVWSVQDLPRVSADDLQSFSGSLSLRLGGR
jgi:hypothetical protein